MPTPDLIGPDGRLLSGGLQGGVERALLDMRGAQPVLLAVVERDGSYTWLAPDGITDRLLDSLKASFLRWLDEYRQKRRGPIRTPP